jgi:predicted RNase H-like nuclease (RuvC/YqgF family)
MRLFDKTRSPIGPWLVITVAAAVTGAKAQGDGQVYRCPGNPVLYTDAINAKEAVAKGCKQLDGAPVTVIAGPKRAPAASSTPAAASRPAETRIDPFEQRARDSDARRILEGELRREQDRLEEMRKEYNNGEPERRGDERNYQKYLDRVADLKSGIARKESDIAALKREMSKLPQ